MTRPARSGAIPSRRPVTLPVALILSVTIGSSLAVAARTSMPHESRTRSPALWAVVAMQLMVVLPVIGYLLHRFGDWALLYLFDSTLLVEPAVLAPLAPLVAVVAFLAARKLVLADHTLAALALMLGSAALAVLTAWAARRQLTIVTTVAALQGSGTTRTLAQTPLRYLLAGGGLAVTISWAVSFWRLVLVGRAQTRQQEVTQRRGDAASKRRAS